MATKHKLGDGTEQIVEDETEARQGEELHTMRYVVAFSTVGAALALAIVWYFFLG